ncbi:unnamed protein product [Brassica oleracea]|uniref:Uncharacterized protein n=1 Tax=Brassica oleracea TaxID=3712 RepID=A0A3P6BA86_BRAOL|nr:unnamed protein product [Brassica oleracea]
MVFPYFLPEYIHSCGEVIQTKVSLYAYFNFLEPTLCFILIFGMSFQNLPLFPLPTHDVIVRSVMGFNLSSR